MSKEKVRLLGDDAHRNPHRRYGPQTGRLVTCGKRDHAHRPEGEQCPDCLSWIESLAEKSQRELDKKARFSKAFNLAPAPRLTPKSIGQRYYEWCKRFNPGLNMPPWVGLVTHRKDSFEAEAANLLLTLGQTQFDIQFP